ncbi:uncharacterized protein LOC104846746 isoform X4 [Loxodonta africana]|uniref:uncharacterized protein LOC104846746 isoform X4 n=1 Tax=Loxodonta africana TaxID=9785 RepID=UPI0030CE5C16
MEGRRIKINSPRLIPMRQRSDMPPTCSLFTDPDTNHPSHDSWRAWPDNRASSSAPRWPQVSRITSRYWALCAGRDTPLLGREDAAVELQKGQGGSHLWLPGVSGASRLRRTRKKDLVIYFGKSAVENALDHTGWLCNPMVEWLQARQRFLPLCMGPP